jgi:hypothetical protein
MNVSTSRSEVEVPLINRTGTEHPGTDAHSRSEVPEAQRGGISPHNAETPQAISAYQPSVNTDIIRPGPNGSIDPRPPCRIRSGAPLPCTS